LQGWEAIGLWGARRDRKPVALLAPFPRCRGCGRLARLTVVGSERGRGHHLKRAVRATLVVVEAPVLDQGLGLVGSTSTRGAHDSTTQVTVAVKP
jgi:hypothetical protein